MLIEVKIRCTDALGALDAVECLIGRLMPASQGDRSATGNDGAVCQPGRGTKGISCRGVERVGCDGCADEARADVIQIECIA